MCLTKDFFVLCPHKHWVSITVNKKDAGKPVNNSCNCSGVFHQFMVTIPEKTYEKGSQSKVNYWKE